jgi:hypothetical protein
MNLWDVKHANPRPQVRDFSAIHWPEAPSFGAFWRLARVKAKGDCRLRGLNRIARRAKGAGVGSCFLLNIARIFELEWCAAANSIAVGSAARPTVWWSPVCGHRQPTGPDASSQQRLAGSQAAPRARASLMWTSRPDCDAMGTPSR